MPHMNMSSNKDPGEQGSNEELEEHESNEEPDQQESNEEPNQQESNEESEEYESNDCGNRDLCQCGNRELGTRCKSEHVEKIKVETKIVLCFSSTN